MTWDTSWITSWMPVDIGSGYTERASGLAEPTPPWDVMLARALEIGHKHAPDVVDRVVHEYMLKTAPAPWTSVGASPFYSYPSAAHSVATLPPSWRLASSARIELSPTVPPEKPCRSQVEPYTGWKSVNLVAKGGRLEVKGQYDTYPVETETAECLKDGHRAADPDCSCGFWAYASSDAARPDGDKALAEVLLFGRVVRGETGYRAERQRIVSVGFEHRCLVCDEEAVGFQVGGACDYRIVSPACAGCSPMGAFTLSQVSAALGAPVSWAE